MSELYDSVDHNNLNFEYVGLTKNVNFYGYMDSKELFNAIKNNQIKFSAVKNKDNTFSNKLKNLKAKKTDEQRKFIDNLNKFDKSGEGVINYFGCYMEMISDANYNARQKY